ncbi:MAG: RraA family protein [Rhizobiaceae bacterium]
MNTAAARISGSSAKSWLQATERLSTALVLDILDSKGLRHQALQPGILARTTQKTTVGFAKTLLWVNFAHDDPTTYDLELKAIDSLQPGEIVVCATGNSSRAGIWGELLTTAAMQRGAVGIVTDGAIRDIAQMDEMGFPVFSRSISPYDSFNRQKVFAFDVRIEIDGVTVEPGDVIIADRDGVAVVPARLSDKVLADALEKAGKEDQFRDAVKGGMGLLEAYEKFHVL